ncbi:uncharacterized protein TRAVEDRAFT_53933 [Trametes versicolor FP-101664 SS1]|uniref:Uncharacterized protein n=1 Tax=Trametes versicolor (strain FP-101664) TaxID=717944 RepID=R7S7C8_TRAVS|nr:uncharacterized protein TRAVEDRAFT_53933 [Trametes versicolor FP-101664 SS1]EIW51938.1 hypothetical protein TRAVEDRAFT_53933 [Trametes versicolor FP-101664 SS1]
MEDVTAEENTNPSDMSSAELQAACLAYSQDIARFHEERGVDIMRYASELVPLREDERTEDNMICALLVVKSLELSKLAARVAWGIGSSMDRYDDQNTDFDKIRSQLQAAFDEVIAIIPPPPTVDRAVDDKMSVPCPAPFEQPSGAAAPSSSPEPASSPAPPKVHSPTPEPYCPPSDGIPQAQVHTLFCDGPLNYSRSITPALVPPLAPHSDIPLLDLTLGDLLGIITTGMTDRLVATLGTSPASSLLDTLGTRLSASAPTHPNPALPNTPTAATNTEPGLTESPSKRRRSY